jgi:hypothetical protein
MTLSEIPDTERGAASRTAAVAVDAKKLGFTNVETGYQPNTGTYTVTCDDPPGGAE